MNRSSIRHIRNGGTFAAAVLASFVLFACASTPSSPPGSAEVRSKLTSLQNDANLAGRARVEIQEAEEAVRLAEQPLPSTEGPLGEHRVYMADRKVEIARAKGNTRYAEDQRARFAEERDAARLRARTQEADRARDDADYARAAANRARDDASQARYDANRSSDDASRARDDASLARSDADAARSAEAQSAADAEDARRAAASARSAEARSAADADAARRAADAARSAEAQSAANAADAARQAAELQRQIDVLEAETTDRGLVLTLGDVLFTTGSAALQNGASNRLDRLVAFLNQYPDRRVLIEGHTDNVGNANYNQGLSQQRAESVQSYLTRQGIGSQRLSASGMGLTQPIASNDSASGRQQNRRVEIIIENPPLVSSGDSQP